MAKHPSLSKNSQDGAQPSDAPEEVGDSRPPRQEKIDDERLVGDSDRGVSQALPTQSSNASSEWTLEELLRAVQELEPEKKKKMN